MRCRHLSVHGCNFESDRRRKVGSGSLIAKERYVRIGGRTESNSNQAGGEVVHGLRLAVSRAASATVREQLRETYTDIMRFVMSLSSGSAVWEFKRRFLFWPAQTGRAGSMAPLGGWPEIPQSLSKQFGMSKPLAQLRPNHVGADPVASRSGSGHGPEARR